MIRNGRQTIGRADTTKLEHGVTGSRCRFCDQPLTYVLVDLGMSPLCESYVTEENLQAREVFYPLVVYVCSSCFLVQLDMFVEADEIFTEYAYFSSYSPSWVEHARVYTEKMIERFELTGAGYVVELASNDGYLLQHFVKAKIPVLGIEPAANIAKVAEQNGVPTLVEFFGVASAARLAGGGRLADLIVGNNVLAQVPDLNDFVKGMKLILKPGGVITMEFPHLVRLIEENQFDTIYHEHFSYFSLYSTEKVFGANGLKLFDVEELTTHGGSLRIYACHQEDQLKTESDALCLLRDQENRFGVTELTTYAAFDQQVRETKRRLLEFLINARREGKTVVGYGAPGKGNTLLNYCGIRTDFIDYTVDRNPYKQGKYLPGTHIPIYEPERIKRTRPDYLLIMPWNLKDEIISQNEFIREWGGKFVVAIPKVAVL